MLLRFDDTPDHSSQDPPTTPLLAALARIRLLAMDVDGVLTDGTLGYSSDGSEIKRFHVHDGLGLTLMGLIGIQVAWISGRTNPAVERRARELGVGHLLQGVRDKQSALQQLGQTEGIEAQEIAYIGDDWNDLGAFVVSGVRIAVADARREIRDHADFVTDAPGGYGAVREVCEALLDARAMRETALQDYLKSLSSDSNPAGSTLGHQ
jgi:3-deoxy-D-manno-octulosonate 8-phosphate phosphatase (KDO 8-P phosphatase)